MHTNKEEVRPKQQETCINEQGVPRQAQTQKVTYRNGNVDKWSVRSTKRFSEQDQVRKPDRVKTE